LLLAGCCSLVAASLVAGVRTADVLAIGSSMRADFVLQL
jgi:hypothetical protein